MLSTPPRVSTSCDSRGAPEEGLGLGRLVSLHRRGAGRRAEASLWARIPRSLPCLVPTPCVRRALGYLTREPVVGYNGGLGPVNDFGEGQLPAGTEKHRDAASLGGRAVTGEACPTPTPVPRQPWLRGQEEKEPQLERGLQRVRDWPQAGTPGPRGKEVGSSSLLPLPRGPADLPAPEDMDGVSKVGLYLQGLEKAPGFSSVARDEAEGGVGWPFPRVCPKEAQQPESLNPPAPSAALPPRPPRPRADQASRHTLTAALHTRPPLLWDQESGALGSSSA